MRKVVPAVMCLLLAAASLSADGQASGRDGDQAVAAAALKRKGPTSRTLKAVKRLFPESRVRDIFGSCGRCRSRTVCSFSIFAKADISPECGRAVLRPGKPVRLQLVYCD